MFLRTISSELAPSTAITAVRSVAIRAGLKAGRQAEEILSYPPFTEWTVAIDNQLAAEALEFCHAKAPLARREPC